MMRIAVTGAAGFVGRNLCAVLRRPDVILYPYDQADSPDALETALRAADVLFHLAGVNRPQHEEEFAVGNAGLTQHLCDRLRALGRAPKIILASSIQAELDNPYGRSKRAAEEALRAFCAETGAEGVAYRMSNLFGKWCRPNYNSVVATFCHHIARDLPIQVSDPARALDLTYIDDVMAAYLGELTAPARPGFRVADPLPAVCVTLGALAEQLRAFRAHRATLLLADYAEPFVRRLYATYLSYLPEDDFAYTLPQHADARGSLAEFLKSPHGGQIFVSRTRPGVTRGNHFHHTKTEKFFVVAGEGIIRFRAIEGGEVLAYPVSGAEFRVVDIPPGYTHSIENVGDGEMVVLFWSSQLLDHDNPDTFALPVLEEADCG